MNNKKKNEQSCIVINKKESTSCITTHLPVFQRKIYTTNQKIY